MLLKLGNDIVDLALPDAQQFLLKQRFLQRVFTECEQETILASSNPLKTGWSLWAAKESAYKACRKQMPTVIFSPQAFAVTETTLLQLHSLENTRQLSGILYREDVMVSLQWQWDENYVHCIGVLLPENKRFFDWQKIKLKIASIDKTQDDSLQTRKIAKQFLSELQQDPQVQIIRAHHRSPPQLWLNNQMLIDQEISLSHDGSLAAIAMYGLC